MKWKLKHMIVYIQMKLLYKLLFTLQLLYIVYIQTKLLDKYFLQIIVKSFL